MLALEEAYQLNADLRGLSSRPQPGSDFTTFVERYDDGSELHHPSPINLVGALDSETAERIAELETLIVEDPDMVKETLEDDDINQWYVSGFDDKSQLLNQKTEGEPSPFDLMMIDIAVAFGGSVFDLMNHDEKTAKIIARLNGPNSDVSSSNTHLWHSDVHQVHITGMITGITAREQDKRFLTAMTLGPGSENDSSNTQYIDGGLVLPSVEFVAASSYTEREMYYGHTNKSAALVTRGDQGSLVRLPTSDWEVPEDQIAQYEEGVIGEIDHLCTHRSTPAAGLFRLSLLAQLKIV